ncbi:MAG: YsnF/AvaK domain-containing protein [Bryobacteraceae bacterium]|nr:YsnF/AvaK domain-containing protein [Bryobacteraceae bacterium]
MRHQPLNVYGLDGPLGTIERLPSDADQHVALRLNDGRSVQVPSSAFTRESDGSLSLRLRSADFDAPARTATHREETVVPVIAEDLIVDKQAVPTGGIRVHKTVTAHEEVVAMPLLRDRVDIRRVVVDREVDGPLPVRREGDTIIVPVVEEVLVVEKRIRLKEELHITRRTFEEHVEERVTLEREDAHVERFDADGRPVLEGPPADTPEPASEPPRLILEPDSLLRHPRRER